MDLQSFVTKPRKKKTYPLRVGVRETTSDLIARLTKSVSHQTLLGMHVRLQETGFPSLRPALKKLSKAKLVSLAERMGVIVPISQPGRVFLAHIFTELDGFGVDDRMVADIGFRKNPPETLLIVHNKRNESASHVFCAQDADQIECVGKHAKGVKETVLVTDVVVCGLTCPCGKCGI
jgi:hypothetical protein